MTERYQSYSDYSNSAIQWLGPVPASWDVIRIGHLFKRTKRTGHSKKELLSVYRDHGVVFKNSRDDNNNKASDDLSAYQLVEPKDLVLNKMKAWQGSVAVSNYEGIVSPAYFVYEPVGSKGKSYHARYVHYLLRCPQYISQYLRYSKGIRVNQWDLDPDMFKSLEVLLPSPEEQRTIAAFLDHETARIDQLIAKQERLIKLLKEKRQAVISHAVTKGLDPDVPMKDSGVEWLGEVPAHWAVLAVNQATQKITNGYVGPTRDILVESGTPYVQATHIKNGKVNFDEGYFVTGTWSLKHKKSILKKGDVLVVQTGAGTGDIGLVSESEEGYNCHALIILQPILRKISGDHLSLVLRSTYGQAVLYSIRTGGMHPHLNCSEVKFVKLPIPSTGEQHAICEYVSDVIKKYADLMTLAQQQIQLLQERRTALISAAVTGKIDVRDWRPAQDTGEIDLPMVAEPHTEYQTRQEPT